jgi:hypothetical protein
MSVQSLGGVEVQQKLSGHISAKVLNATGEVVREIAEFKNLIVNAGLDHLMVVSQPLGALAEVCKVGTGPGAPAVGDTTLPGYVRATSFTLRSGAHQTAAAPYYYEMTTTYLFALGAINATLTCIGVHNSTSNSSIFAWSQIKDSSNNPTTLTVLSTEQLQVTYRFRVYAPSFTTSGSIVIGGDATHAFTMYAHNYGNSGFGLNTGSVVPVPAQITAQTWTAVTPPADILGAVTYTGASTLNMPMSYSSYVAGSFYRQMTGFMATTSNVPGSAIKGLALTAVNVTQGPRFFIQLSTFIPKTTSNTLTITYGYSLARYP